MNDYASALERVYRMIKQSPTLDTARPQRVMRVLERTGNPHLALQLVHIAGTKGKGSVCAMIASGGVSAGLRVGMYTSPHLHSLRERIRINGEPISMMDFVMLVERWMPYIEAEDGIGFTETLTVLALHAFAQAEVDLAIIETHVGGRYDATNAITPLVSAITTIDYDHTDLLGETLSEITYHKAGIIKSEVPVVTAPQPPDVVDILGAEAEERAAPLHIIDDLIVHPASSSGQVITLDKVNYHTNLIGMHQGINLAVALTVIDPFVKRTLPISRILAQPGLAVVRWGGRLEQVRTDPPLILDIAHNVAAAQTLRVTLDALYPNLRRVWVYGSKANKDVTAILQTLIQPKDSLILTQTQSPPTAPPTDLLRIKWTDTPPSTHIAPSVGAALQLADAIAHDGIIVITGSIFVVAAARALLLGIEPEQGSAV